MFLHGVPPSPFPSPGVWAANADHATVENRERFSGHFHFRRTNGYTRGGAGAEVRLSKNTSRFAGWIF